MKNFRVVKPLTIADPHSYVHPAVLEKQLADAKASLTDQGAVEQASHETEAGKATVPDNSPPPVPP